LAASNSPDGGTLLLDENRGDAGGRRKRICSAFWKTTKYAGRQQGGTPVDVRVLAATNKEPEQAVAKRIGGRIFIFV